MTRLFGNKNIDFAFWQRYSSEQQYREDINSYIFINQAGINLLVQRGNTLKNRCEKDAKVDIQFSKEENDICQDIQELREWMITKAVCQTQSDAVQIDEAVIMGNLLENIDVNQQLQTIKAQLSQCRDDMISLIIKQLSVRQEKARELIVQYCKFMTLIRVTKIAHTPSDQVDFVWHLHMGYTQQYRQFCKIAMGRFISHNPTQGGQQEDEKFNNQYDRTLMFLQYLFNEKPNQHYWPKKQVRFSRELYISQCWVNVNKLLKVSVKVGIQANKAIKFKKAPEIKDKTFGSENALGSSAKKNNKIQHEGSKAQDEQELKRRKKYQDQYQLHDDGFFIFLLFTNDIDCGGFGGGAGCGADHCHIDCEDGGNHFDGLDGGGCGGNMDVGGTGCAGGNDGGAGCAGAGCGGGGGGCGGGGCGGGGCGGGGCGGG